MHAATRALISCENCGEKMPYRKTVFFVMQHAEDSVVLLIKCTTWDKSKKPHIFAAQWWELLHYKNVANKKMLLNRNIL